MLPILVHPKHTQALVIGDGPATSRRVQMLDDAGMSYERVKESPLHDGLEEDFDNELLYPISVGLVFVADFDDETSAQIYQHYKAQGLLVNVEDKKAYCDFHVPALVRRGDLLLTVSTGAASPRLARRIRMMLEQLFPASWTERLELIRQKRDAWRARGDDFEALKVQTDKLLDEQGWFKARCECLRQGEK